MALSKLAPSSLFALLVAAALAACGPAAAPNLSTSTDAISASAVDPGNAGGNRLTTVMSRNLYLGAELGPAIAATNLDDFLKATTEIWAMVQTNDFSVRAQGIADEIAAARPEVVGLQEAYTWTFRTAAQAPEDATVVYDYVPQLIDALAERGLHYRAAASVTLFDFEAPILTPEGLAFVGITDHGVILAREDVTAVNPSAHVFDTLLPLNVFGAPPMKLPRGWVSVDVKDQGEWYRFVSVHLEAYYAPVRVAQAMELAAALAEVPGRLIVAGDLNSDPGTEGAGVLVGSGLADLWPALHSGEPGFTSPYHENLTFEEVTLDERIDYVLFRGDLTPIFADVVGEELGDRVGGLWPSDHAGVVGTFRLEEPRFLVLR
ncbi:endonuclease/exonuclease/phosphatase family protein [Anaeromyxobacter terrae]|uniref:endonuclease/exonuclease/phosphatase family protein n=1 Tax=Anaeromyxobacter terrae TaxID=2925406 RepID=UPI001F5A9143|nr:endonuclease/exonuclease/phosphatase family protein [Anaeromyxobacter sp. SG22]